MKSNQIHPVEKGIIAVAITTSIVHLSLIAFAAIKLGISVPSCVTDVKPFQTGQFIQHGPKRYEAHIVARMWSYEPHRIELPTGSILDIFLVSQDVNHGFHIHGTNVNLMAAPKVVNSAQVKFDRPGNYPIVCHEYCGAGHQAMNAMIVVSDQIQVGTAEGLPSQTPSVAQTQETPHPGKTLLQTKGCIACHSLDGKAGIGPTFQGLWGSTAEFIDGSKHLVDAAYIRRCIQDPSKTLLKGFSPVMPALPVADQEIDQIIDFLKKQ